MLDILTYVAIALAVVAVVLLAYAATKPDTFRVQRTRGIDAPAERIFPLIANLKSMNTWNPFVEPDPAIKLTYSGPAHSKGAAHAWEGNNRVGKGRVEITDSVPSSRIVMKLDMIKPIEGHNRVEFTLEPKDGATTVTWAMSGQSAFITKLMGVFVSMDKMVGRAFENGLADLKSLAER